MGTGFVFLPDFLRERPLRRPAPERGSCPAESWVREEADLELLVIRVVWILPFGYRSFVLQLV